MTTTSHDKGLLTSLFDIGFTSFITSRFLKVIYALVGRRLQSWPAAVPQPGLAGLRGVPARSGRRAGADPALPGPRPGGMELIALLFRMGELLKALRTGPSDPLRSAGPQYGPGPTA